MIRKDTLLAWPMILFMVLFFLSPLLVLFGISLRVGEDGWGLGNFAAFLSDPFARGVLTRTLMLGVKVTFWVSVLSLPLVMLYWHGGKRLRGIILICTLLPMLTSNVVRTFAWVVILGRTGPISQSFVELGLSERPFSLLFSEMGLIMALVQIELPLLLLPIFSVLNRADRKTLEAAETLGAGRWRAWFSAIFPQIVPAVLAGWVLVFASATTSYVTHTVIGGARLIFLPQFVYREVGVLFQWPMAAAISIMLLASTGAHLPSRQIGVQAVDEGAVVELRRQRLEQVAVLQDAYYPSAIHRSVSRAAFFFGLGASFDGCELRGNWPGSENGRFIGDAKSMTYVL